MAPSSAQADVLDRQTSAARALWNLIHAHHTFYEGSKRWPSWTESDTAIRQARKDIDWLAVKQKSGLNRSILDQGWTQILALLTYKADQAGARVVAVRPHGTSQTCHQCRSTAKGQRENQALFRCADPACGWTGNADTNAAIVIKHRGQEVAAQDVEPNATRQATKRQNPKTAT